MTTNEDMEFVRELRVEAERLMGEPAAYRLMRDAADWIEAALAAAPDHQAEAETHGMLPGSHERGGGAECRCGMPWDYWNSRCLSFPAGIQAEAACPHEEM
ncbi:hypothetical protein [Microbacterium sp.]|uniref:hypothetical protein n=1 Tax=Microbacterium sp. TaxID=51671 RepID=UPI0039E6639A